MAVTDPISGQLTDYRAWTRIQVDNKFEQDLRKLCDTALVDTGDDQFSQDCYDDASEYRRIVRRWGKVAFDANAAKVGTQKACRGTTNPVDGCRHSL